MNKIHAHLSGNSVTSNSSDAYTLQQKSSFGERVENKVQYSAVEALYLAERNKLEIFDSKNKSLSIDHLQKRFQQIDKKFKLKYIVFKDLRNKGYIVKTALKFGAEFRVYPKGSSPGKTHSKWIVFTDHESKSFNWHEFSSKNRVAHSTKKNLLLAIVDEESDVTYYEIKWIKP
ncbi:MAG: tRNA-intron lyase [Nanoarchaeota archaeon]|nr:tRNA-intron lyase [Nanoarchaeota archaeon]